MHPCAADRDVDVVTLTQTLADDFGCGVVILGTVVLPNNAMQWSDPEPGRPNSLAPVKRRLNNMTPLTVVREGRPFLVVGAPGGVRVINAVPQIISNVIDRGLGIQGAVSAPPIGCGGSDVLVDSRFPDGVIDGLR